MQFTHRARPCHRHQRPLLRNKAVLYHSCRRIICMICASCNYPPPSPFSTSLPTCAPSTPTPPCAVRLVALPTLPYRPPIATGPHRAVPRCFTFAAAVAVESARPALSLRCAHPTPATCYQNGVSSRCAALLFERGRRRVRAKVPAFAHFTP